jgi:hypothetical protein
LLAPFFPSAKFKLVAKFVPTALLCCLLDLLSLSLLLLLLRITNCLLKIRIGFLSTLLEKERNTGGENGW